MTLEQLRVFVEVAEREHMTRAAEALHLTQSAVSAAVAALEARHGVHLFHRVGRRIELTDVGQAFLGEARAVLARAQAAERLLAQFGALDCGALALVASQTIASYWLPPRLARFRACYPGIAVELIVGNSDQAAAHVRDGSAELGFVEGEIDDAALARWPVGQDELRLVSAASAPTPAPTPAPSSAAITPEWLRAADWVLREPGSGTRSTFEAALAGLGVAPRELRVAMVLPSNEAVRSAVESGMGCSMLSSLVVEPAVRAGHLQGLPFTLPPRPFYALRHKERYRSRAADALLALIGAEAPRGRGAPPLQKGHSSL